MKFLKCPVCGNITEMVVDHHVPVMCCGQKMEVLEANVTDAATEKHVPVAELKNGVLHVSVGSVMHPSSEEHHIAFIAVKAGNKVLRADLQHGASPEADFYLGEYAGTVEVYEYCNLHGLWKKDLIA